MKMKIILILSCFLIFLNFSNIESKRNVNNNVRFSKKENLRCNESSVQSSNINYGSNDFSYPIDYSCRILASSSYGNGWEDIRNSIGIFYSHIGTRDQVMGNGVLIMNTNGINTPYFLTADHVIDQQPASLYINGESFNYTVISRTYGPEADCALLLLDKVPTNSATCYAGWSRFDYSSSVKIFHCPDISSQITYDERVLDYAADNNPAILDGEFCELHVDDGATMAGSSGAPFFNQDKKIIAQLFGTYEIGPDPCTFDGRHIKGGRFSISWNKGSYNGHAALIKTFLDPSNQNSMTTNTTNVRDLIPNPATIYIQGPEYLNFSAEYYISETLPSGSYIELDPIPNMTITRISPTRCLLVSNCYNGIVTISGKLHSAFGVLPINSKTINVSAGPSSISITGNPTLCQSADYSVNVTLRAGCFIHWSSNVPSIVPEQLTPTTCRITTTNYNGPLLLTATLDQSTCCANTVATKAINVISGPPTYYTLYAQLTTGGTTDWLKDNNCLLTYTFPGMYSGDVYVLDPAGLPVITNITWTKISQTGCSFANTGSSNNGKHLFLNFKPLGCRAVFRMTASNSCGYFTYDFLFNAGSSLICSPIIEMAKASPQPEDAPVPVAVYPNPTSGEFTIDYGSADPESGIKEVVITNSLGAGIFRKSYDSQKSVTVNLSGQNPGIYFLEISDGKERICRQISIKK
jgi:hypothetical protein